MSEYTEYHHAMQHAQIHPATMTQIPMSQMTGGLNLVMSSSQGLLQHQLGQGHQIVYANVQPQALAGTQQVVVQQHAQVQQQTVQHHGKGKNKKPKVNKDGVPAPKRAATPFINFTQWYREELKKAGRPVPKIAEFGKECAAKWAEMGEEEKRPFVESAERDRERYRREMAIFKPARDESKPKRPGTAFMLFMVDFRKEMAGKEPEGGVAALAKLGGERWRNMTDDDKRPYVDKQNTERVRYESAMEDYRRKGQQALNAQAGVSADGKEGAAGAESDNTSDSLQTGGAATTTAQPATTTTYLVQGVPAQSYSTIQGQNYWQ